MDNNDLLPRCTICSKIGVNGIWLAGNLICVECEKKIVMTDAAEPEYRFFVERLKRALKDKKADKTFIEDDVKLGYIKNEVEE